MEHTHQPKVSNTPGPSEQPGHSESEDPQPSKVMPQTLSEDQGRKEPLDDHSPIPASNQNKGEAEQIIIAEEHSKTSDQQKLSQPQSHYPAQALTDGFVSKDKHKTLKKKFITLKEEYFKVLNSWESTNNLLRTVLAERRMLNKKVEFLLTAQNNNQQTGLYQITDEELTGLILNQKQQENTLTPQPVFYQQLEEASPQKDINITTRLEKRNFTDFTAQNSEKKRKQNSEAKLVAAKKRGEQQKIEQQEVDNRLKSIGNGDTYLEDRLLKQANVNSRAAQGFHSNQQVVTLPNKIPTDSYKRPKPTDHSQNHLNNGQYSATLVSNSVLQQPLKDNKSPMNASMYQMMMPGRDDLPVQMDLPLQQIKNVNQFEAADLIQSLEGVARQQETQFSKQPGMNQQHLPQFNPAQFGQSIDFVQEGFPNGQMQPDLMQSDMHFLQNGNGLPQQATNGMFTSSEHRFSINGATGNGPRM